MPTGSPRPELTRGQWWLLLALAALLAGLIAAGPLLQHANRALQEDIAQRQQYLQQTEQLEQVQRELRRALAALAERNDDAEVRALLAGAAPAR